jgi:hypothetical protein
MSRLSLFNLKTEAGLLHCELAATATLPLG